MISSHDKPVRVLAVLPYPLGRVGSQRYRIEQWAPLLRADGFEFSSTSFLSDRAMDVLYRPGHVLAKLRETLAGYLRRMHERSRFAACDVLFLHREALPFATAALERALLGRAPVVYDFDDAIYLPSTSTNNRWLAAIKRPRKTASLCRFARHVTPGNAHLAEYARRQSPRVTVIPSSIDTEIYACTTRPPNPRPIVGWTGSPTTVPYLAGIQQQLATLRRELDFELRVIGAAVELPGIDTRCVPWCPDTEVDDLRPLDVGLMPLPDDPWTRGKCGLKALQYMALAIPPVVSPVGANREIVRDGENGFVATTPSDWVGRLRALLTCPERRRALGAAGRRTVETRYSARVQAPRLADVLRSVVVPRG